MKSNQPSQKINASQFHTTTGTSMVQQKIGESSPVQPHSNDNSFIEYTANLVPGHEPRGPRPHSSAQANDVKPQIANRVPASSQPILFAVRRNTNTLADTRTNLVDTQQSIQKVYTRPGTNQEVRELAASQPQKLLLQRHGPMEQGRTTSSRTPNIRSNKIVKQNINNSFGLKNANAKQNFDQTGFATNVTRSDQQRTNFATTLTQPQSQSQLARASFNDRESNVGSGSFLSQSQQVADPAVIQQRKHSVADTPSGPRQAKRKINIVGSKSKNITLSAFVSPPAIPKEKIRYLNEAGNQAPNLQTSQLTIQKHSRAPMTQNFMGQGLHRLEESLQLAKQSSSAATNGRLQRGPRKLLLRNPATQHAQKPLTGNFMTKTPDGKHDSELHVPEDQQPSGTLTTVKAKRDGVSKQLRRIKLSTGGVQSLSNTVRNSGTLQGEHPVPDERPSAGISRTRLDDSAFKNAPVVNKTTLKGDAKVGGFDDPKLNQSHVVEKRAFTALDNACSPNGRRRKLTASKNSFDITSLGLAADSGVESATAEPIHSFSTLFAILGITSFNDDDKTFTHKGRQYRLDLEHMMRQPRNVKIGKVRSHHQKNNTVSSENSLVTGLNFNKGFDIQISRLDAESSRADEQEQQKVVLIDEDRGEKVRTSRYQSQRKKQLGALDSSSIGQAPRIHAGSPNYTPHAAGGGVTSALSHKLSEKFRPFLNINSNHANSQCGVYAPSSGRSHNVGLGMARAKNFIRMDSEKQHEMSAREKLPSRNDMVRQRTQGHRGNGTLTSNTNQESSDLFTAGPGLHTSFEELAVDKQNTQKQLAGRKGKLLNSNQNLHLVRHLASNQLPPPAHGKGRLNVDSMASNDFQRLFGAERIELGAGGARLHGISGSLQTSQPNLPGHGSSPALDNLVDQQTPVATGRDLQPMQLLVPQSTQENNVHQGLFSDKSDLQSQYSHLDYQQPQDRNQRFLPAQVHDMDSPRSQKSGGIKPSEPTHLSFLFASPLMLKTPEGKFYDVLPRISFHEEFEQIRQSILDKRIEFRYSYLVATQMNLKRALRQNPAGLHFSGHGFVNDEALYRGDKKGWSRNKLKGDVLMFENEAGASEFFYEDDLKKVLISVNKDLDKKDQEDAVFKQSFNALESECDKSQTGTSVAPTAMESECGSVGNLKFVFVASCHSERIGAIFKQAKVPHVICIDQKQTILDKAAIEFTKHFYDEVFDCYKSICDAFQEAKEKVEKQYGKFVADKLILMKDHGDDVPCPSEADSRLRGVRGTIREVSEDPEKKVHKVLPNRISSFTFRNQDVFDILSKLTDKDIVLIFGLPGLGKSALLKHVVFFVAERNFYKDGVVYVDLSNANTFKEAITELCFALKQNGEGDPEQYVSFNADQLQQELQHLKQRFAARSKQPELSKLLVAVDHTNSLNQADTKKFHKFLNEVASSQTKILFTSCAFEPSSMIEGAYAVKRVQRLQRKEAIELFMAKIPLADRDKKEFLDFSQITELHDYTVKLYNGGKIAAPCGLKHTHGNQCVIKYLENHPIFDYFAGIPFVISMVAPMSVQRSLKEIFAYLVEKDQSDTNEQLNIKDGNLIDCLEFSLSHFQREQEEDPANNALDVWFLIGTQGPGILYRSLSAIFVDEEEDEKIIKEQQQEESNDPNSPSPQQPRTITQRRETIIFDKTEKGPMTTFRRLERSLNDLVEFNLIEQEVLDKAGKWRTYRVCPFVSSYLQRKIPLAKKAEFLNLAAFHLSKILLDAKHEYAQELAAAKTRLDGEKVVKNLNEKLQMYEKQIRHVVKELIAVKAEGSKIEDSFDTDSEFADKEINDRLENSSSELESLNDNEVNKRASIKRTMHKRRSTKEDIMFEKEKLQMQQKLPQVSEQLRKGRSTFVEKPRVQPLLKEAAEEYKGKVDDNGDNEEEERFNLLIENNQRQQRRHGSHALVNDSRRVNPRQIGPSELERRRAQESRNPLHAVETSRIEEVQEDSDDQNLNAGDGFGETGGTQSKLAPADDTPGSARNHCRSASPRPNISNFAQVAESNADFVKDMRNAYGVQVDDVDESVASLPDNTVTQAVPENNKFQTLKVSSPGATVNDSLIEDTVIEEFKTSSNDALGESSGPFDKAASSSLQIAASGTGKEYKQEEESINDNEMHSWRRISMRLKKCPRAQIKLNDDAFNRMSIRISKDKTLNRKSGPYSWATLQGLTGVPRDGLLNTMKVSQGSEEKKRQLPTIPEKTVSYSAPAKLGDNEVMESPAASPVKQPAEASPRKSKEIAEESVELHSRCQEMEMETHEKLLFHFLSVLALIPARRGEFDEIVQKFDTIFTVKDGHAEDLLPANAQKAVKKEANYADQMRAEVDRKFKTQNIMIDIPDSSILLLANLKLLELFMLNDDVKQEHMALTRSGRHYKKAKNRYEDPIYEFCHQVKQSFENIQFTKGLAILLYVQAKRQIKKFKRTDRFKELIDESAKNFEKVHCLQGVQQCCKAAQYYLEKSVSIAFANSKTEQTLDNATLEQQPTQLQKYKSLFSEEIQENESYLNALKAKVERMQKETDVAKKSAMAVQEESLIKGVASALCVQHKAGEKPRPDDKNAAVVACPDVIFDMLLNPEIKLEVCKKIDRANTTDN